jgi:hypothetical protein
MLYHYEQGLVPFRIVGHHVYRVMFFNRHACPFRRLTPALSCTADGLQGQCAAAFSAEPAPPRWQAESRVSFNAWLDGVRGPAQELAANRQLPEAWPWLRR